MTRGAGASFEALATVNPLVALKDLPRRGTLQAQQGGTKTHGQPLPAWASDTYFIRSLRKSAASDARLLYSSTGKR